MAQTEQEETVESMCLHVCPPDVSWMVLHLEIFLDS